MSAIDRLLHRFLERVVFGFVAHLPGRVVASIAVALYAGVGLALPIGLGWSVPYLVDANFLGTTFAGLVILGWLVVQLQARDRQHLLDWTTELRHLDAEEFEWLVGEAFKRDGWKVEGPAARTALTGTLIFGCPKQASVDSSSASDGLHGMSALTRSESSLELSSGNGSMGAKGSSSPTRSSRPRLLRKAVASGCSLWTSGISTPSSRKFGGKNRVRNAGLRCVSTGPRTAGRSVAPHRDATANVTWAGIPLLPSSC